MERTTSSIVRTAFCSDASCRVGYISRSSCMEIRERMSLKLLPEAHWYSARTHPHQYSGVGGAGSRGGASERMPISSKTLRAIPVPSIPATMRGSPSPKRSANPLMMKYDMKRSISIPQAWTAYSTASPRPIMASSR